MAPPQMAYSSERARYIEPAAAPMAIMPVRMLTPVETAPRSVALTVVRLKVAVVEGDTAVRSMLVRAVERLGHTAVVPGAGLAAVGHPAYAGEIDCVLLDVPLPATFGPRTAAAVESIGNGAGLVLMSHAPANEVIAALPELNDPVILPKPFALAELDDAIRRAVRRPAKSGVAA